MKIELTRLIGRDIGAVWEAVTDPAGLSSWQPSLVTVRTVTGRRDTAGGVSEFVYDENGREIRLQETIREAQRPELLVAEYRGDRAVTIARSRFEASAGDETRWSITCQVRFRGLVPRLLAPFLKGSVRARIEADMERLQRRLEEPAEESS